MSGLTETRLASTLRIYRAPGRTAVDIECPFCQCVTQAYVWSLAGSGKRCECGALLQGSGIGNTTATRSRPRPLFTEDEMLADACGVPNYGKGLRS